MGGFQNQVPGRVDQPRFLPCKIAPKQEYQPLPFFGKQLDHPVGEQLPADRLMRSGFVFSTVSMALRRKTPFSAHRLKSPWLGMDTPASFWSSL